MGFDDVLASAAEAVRREYRESLRPRKLRCLDAVLIPEGILRLDVGRIENLDIAWEGSTAFRPVALEDYGGGLPDESDLLWRAEVVEVDEVSGHVYVVGLSETFDTEIVRGTFFIREFQFMDPLRAIYHAQDLAPVRGARLAEWLVKTAGRSEPRRITTSAFEGSVALDEIWGFELCYLWGPPGTGKTYTLGEHVARLAVAQEERVLIVSTTNKATDEVALAVGRALRRLDREDVLGRVVRVGKGGILRRFEAEGLVRLLEGSETLARQELARLTEELRSVSQSEERARIRARLAECRRRIANGSIEAALGSERVVVVTTSYNALQMLRSPEYGALLAAGAAPFTTLIVDEAGLISRATTAALALHARSRVLLAGDPKQLAPISRIARVLPPSHSRWLASSGLSHLIMERKDPAAMMLQLQHRMHPEIRRVVSEFQYSGRLSDSELVTTRTEYPFPFLDAIPRALWYVLDEDQDDRSRMRAERGPGNKSWVREATLDVLKKLFAAAPALASSQGLFLSPFVAQARSVDEWLQHNGFGDWRASTIHAQQGAEADIVVFDTVNAGSHVWPIDEWKRLVNVGLSRAREFVILVSSRDEMREPYLRDLKKSLAPKVLRWRGSRYFWEDVLGVESAPAQVPHAGDPDRLGTQIESRKSMRLLLNREQERLCGLELDGKPRLVRGVAGSGKTVILANWLARTVLLLRGQDGARIWVVYANKSLRALIDTTTQSAWEELTEGEPFPWDIVEFWHIMDLLQHLRQREGMPGMVGFDYEAAARSILKTNPPLEPLCRALFVDEAQDLGDETLRLLAALVETTDTSDANSKSIIVFYDNAQNLYQRTTPKWSGFGLDMRGRSAVLKESFRSTHQISEFALNVLYRLQPPERDADHRELIKRQLIERVERPEGPWWRIHFIQVAGPPPRVRVFPDLDTEVTALATRVRELVTDEGVRPVDIRILCIGRHISDRLASALPAALVGLDVQVQHQTSSAFSDESNVLVYTTPHSFKGYDAEVVLVAAADHFRSNAAGINAAGLYVALTRARSILEVYCAESVAEDGSRIVSVLRSCDEDLDSSDAGDPRTLGATDLATITSLIGSDHVSWLSDLHRRYHLILEPLRSPEDEILGHPVFHFTDGTFTYACLTTQRPREQARLEDAGIILLSPGDAIPFSSNTPPDPGSAPSP